MKNNKAGKVALFLMLISLPLMVGGCRYTQTTPDYYTYDDLYNGFRDYRDKFSFDDASYAKNGDVTGIIPPLVPEAGEIGLSSKEIKNRVKAYPLTRGKGKNKQVSGLKSSSTKVNSFDELHVKLIDLNAYPSDMIFIRGQGSLMKFITSWFSAWTHVALIHNMVKNEVFESMPKYGVNVNNIDESWENVIAYGVKSANTTILPHYDYVWLDGESGEIVRHLGSDAHYKAMKAGEKKYTGIHYWPDKVDRNVDSKNSFLKKWSKKDDFDSMYCSKLVYNVFKDADSRLNLDSDRTKCYVSDLTEGGNGGQVNAAKPLYRTSALSDKRWIGVSPDDIWASEYTDPFSELCCPESLFFELVKTL